MWKIGRTEKNDEIHVVRIKKIDCIHLSYFFRHADLKAFKQLCVITLVNTHFAAAELIMNFK